MTITLTLNWYHKQICVYLVVWKCLGEVRGVRIPRRLGQASSWASRGGIRRGFKSRLSLLSGVRSILLRLIDYCQRVSSDSVWQLWSRSSSGGSNSSSPSALRQFVTRFDTPPSHACVRPRRFYLNKNRTHYSSQRRQLPSLPLSDSVLGQNGSNLFVYSRSETEFEFFTAPLGRSAHV